MTTLKTSLEVVLKNPNILLPQKHLLLLSHMRANTSLIGHLLGNHDDINGYYEMHIGYYSWKSLIRQKIEFFDAHPKHVPSLYLFDKILHSEHYVAPEVLYRDNVIPLFSLRNPVDTIPSIVKLYSKVNQKHEFFTVAGAIDYYEQRLDVLLNLARKLAQDFYYIDAEAIKTKTDETLTYLSQVLTLSHPLKPTYRSNVKTGQGDSGDHSENLKKGFISTTPSNYQDFNWAHGERDRLSQKYQDVRNEMIKLSLSSCLK
ncbi:hypothetical protein SO574_21450 (plasmid) [Vibrio alfacsensis]|uniref:hypothetical protein n=1 Tax=Vibrio alfacsensis TaxID=1074311 RepID=UPI002ADE406A|nr:hypothetical protein [Vibrio alfacsensis]WQE79155.1 hypothetical protein SO574_21450 [Vibrio alfacsensis]